MVSVQNPSNSFARHYGLRDYPSREIRSKSGLLQLSQQCGLRFQIASLSLQIRFRPDRGRHPRRKSVESQIEAHSRSYKWSASVMNFSEYQQRAKETAKYPVVGHAVIYPTLGLTNEAGEVAGKIKKIFRDK